MLQNNSQSMKTVVETYLVEETVDLIHDGEKLQKWNDMVAFLELEGQKTIVHEEKSPIPFLWMNETMVNMFETLCPTKVKIGEYNKMPIPLEILDLVSLSKREGYFDSLEIWYDEKTPDPVCIGLKYDPKHSQEGDWYRHYKAAKYLIGRWSDVKATFTELIVRAKARYISVQKNDLENRIKSAKRELEDLESNADRRFGSLIADASISPDIIF